MRNVVIDTDIWADCDDTAALILGEYLNKTGKISLKGITTVYWPAKEKARLAAKVVYLAGGNTPVYSGCDNPIKQRLKPSLSVHDTSQSAHGKSIKLFSDPLTSIQRMNETMNIENKREKYINVGRKLLSEKDDYKFSDVHAVDYLLSEKDIIIAAIGPLTNIASAILRDKNFPEKVKEIYFMGDCFEKKDCWNIKCDKKAFDIVKNSGIKFNLVTRETCKQVWLDETDLKKIEEKETPLNELFYKHAKLWKEKRKWNIVYMYDPLTVACAAGLGFVEFENPEENVYVSKKIDATAFKKYLMEALV